MPALVVFVALSSWASSERTSRVHVTKVWSNEVAFRAYPDDRTYLYGTSTSQPRKAVTGRPSVAGPL